MSKPPNNAVRWILFVIALAGLAAVFLGMVAELQPRHELAEVEGYRPWKESTVRLAETLPVQDGGRVKPLSTLAGFTMLRLHGARSMSLLGEGGEKVKIGPTEWMLDCLFRPRLAVEMPTFRVDNAAVLKAVGLEGKGRRDRYSYLELEEARQELGKLAAGYEQIPDKEREPLQRQVVALEYKVRIFEALVGHFSFARMGVEMMPEEGDSGMRRSELSMVLATAPVIREVMAKAGDDPSKVPAHVRLLVEQVLDLASFGSAGMFVLPPADPADEAWRSAGHRIMEVLRGDLAEPATAIGDIRAMELLVRSSAGGEEEFAEQLEKFRERVIERAGARGEYRGVEMEASYYRAKWILRALVMFLAAFLLALGMWITTGSRASRWLAAGSTVMVLGGLGLVVAAIAQRSWIMQRPPIGNLYDTIPFITAGSVAALLVIEWMTRRRFALGIAAVLGVLGLALARRFEVGDASDHMDPLVAVLDSNFWLTVHVITITLGYSAGLLSAALSHGYLLMRGLGLDGGDRGFQRSLTRAVFGGICLTLFLSLVGTVLGGIWANYSWGRFWGWDPKENGALLIVLWTLVILHGRLGGLLREWGLHLASVFGACVVAFSWWHVNFLGVGLHNYGFTSGKAMIWAFYSVELAVIVFGAIAWAVAVFRRKPAQS